MQQDNNLIRSMVRGGYDMQKLRIQMGNRITSNFKAKLGLEQNGMSEKDLEKQEKKVLASLRESYKRITDGIVGENIGAVEGKLPTPKKFKGDELISTYTELVLVDQYMALLRNEEAHFRRFEAVLKDIPVFHKFLQHVDGLGATMAGVIISEIDIRKAKYPSSLWMYAGLDAVTVAKYVDDKGVERIVPQYQVRQHCEEHYGEPLLVDGKYPVTFMSVGRSRRDFCLVQREYKTREGDTAYHSSITFNPFLKTKLVGVLGSSFLRSGKSLVDGKPMGGLRRLALAKTYGFKPESEGDDVGDQVIEFLREKGHNVVVEPSKYGKSYYDYRNRLDNDPRHNDKSDGHKHNMAIRFMVKRFLVDLHMAWREIEGLPVTTEYSEGKLGMRHGVQK